MLLLFLVCLTMLVLFFGAGRGFACVVAGGRGWIFTDYVFAGMVVFGVVLTYISLILPLNKLAYVLIAGVLPLFVVQYKEWSNYLKTANKSLIIIVSIVGVLVCFRASAFIDSYDSGLYHVQSIKWIGEYSVIPGLGNLHGRLAFNPSIFILSAAFSFASVFKQPVYAVNAFLLIMFFIYVIHVYLRFSQSNRAEQAFILLSGSLLLAYLMLMLDPASPDPDIAAMVITMYVFMRFLELLSEPKHSEIHSLSGLLVLLVALSFYALTVKLSVLFIVALPLVLLIVSFREITLKKFFLITALGVFILLPWIIRNHFLSGYLVYPIPETNFFSADWKIPLSLVAEEKNWIRSWALLPGFNYHEVLNLSLGEQLKFWFERQHLVYQLLIIMAFLSPGPVLLIAWKRENPNVVWFVTLWAISYAAMIFWLLSAPELRFAISFLIIASCFWILPLLLYLKPGIIISGLSRKLFPFILGILLLYSLVVVYCISGEAFEKRHLVYPKNFDLASDHYKIPGKWAEIYFLKDIPVYVTIDDDRCFNGPLPCTPRIIQGLSLRGERLSEGFVIK